MVIADGCYGVERIVAVLHKNYKNKEDVANIDSMEVVVFSDDDVVVEWWLYMMKMATSVFSGNGGFSCGRGDDV
ncbi:hypothetical protein Tco_1371086 [Tanacetum coccineum]